MAVVFIFFSAATYVNSESLIQNTPKFDSSVPEYTKSGFFKLSWAIENKKDVIFRVIESQDPAFENYKVKYEGPDLATFVSGLPDGEYYYRVRAISGESSWKSDWSKTLNVTVEHHSLRLAMTLMVIGAVVFISTVGLILYGNTKFNNTDN